MLFKSGQVEKANEVKAKTAGLKETSKELTEQLNTKANELDELLYKIPNVPHESVPEGNTDEDNTIESTFGEIPKFDFPVKAHYEI